MSAQARGLALVLPRTLASNLASNLILITALILAVVLAVALISVPASIPPGPQAPGLAWAVFNRKKTVMQSVPFRFAPATLSATILLVLAGCSTPTQQAGAPQAAASDTAVRERETRPASAFYGGGQIQIPFGTSEPTQAELLAERQRQSTTQGLMPEGRTFLGSIPCETAACSVQRVTLTLLPDGRWRRLSQPLAPSGAARTDSGCWRPEPGTRPLIHLLPARVNGSSAGQAATAVASFSMQSPAVLNVHTLGGKAVTRRYTLNIQAEKDFTRALQNDTSFFCPAP